MKSFIADSVTQMDSSSVTLGRMLCFILGFVICASGGIENGFLQTFALDIAMPACVLLVFMLFNSIDRKGMFAYTFWIFVHFLIGAALSFVFGEVLNLWFSFLGYGLVFASYLIVLMFIPIVVRRHRIQKTRRKYQKGI